MFSSVVAAVRDLYRYHVLDRHGIVTRLSNDSHSRNGRILGEK